MFEVTYDEKLGDKVNKHIYEDLAVMRKIVGDAIRKNEQGEIITDVDTDRFIQSKKINLHSIYKPQTYTKFYENNIQFLVLGYVDFPKRNKKYRLRLSLINTKNGTFVLDQYRLMNKGSSAIRKAVTELSKNFVHKIRTGDYLSYKDAVVYKVGDIGPAGGIIFYAKSGLIDGWRYLEASPAESEFKSSWGYSKNDESGPYASGNGTAIGEGFPNTRILSHLLFEAGETRGAAFFCSALTIGGFEDWFLPSRDELNLMYKNLSKHKLGNFLGDAYWSSSQSTEKNVWFQTFNNGRQYYTGIKTDVLYVRAIRQF
ncbi:MAG: hypothetical protein Ta2G_07320 [Termitinemataceae bacterium]|nr:MAG: hypothetical protein Ta2G_07320 [Termitinemataceae bacterium]